MSKRITWREIIATPALMLLASLWAGGVIGLLALAVSVIAGAFQFGGGVENIAS